MILLWLFKIGSIIRSVADFVLTHWRVFLIIAICCYAFFYKTAYDREKAAYTAHILADVKAADIRRAENKVKEDRHVKEMEKAHAETVALMKQYNLDRARDAAKLKELYANKINSDFRLNSYADWLSIQQQRKAAGLPTSESNTSALASGWQDCDAANTRLQESYDTLENACAITTLDYNELRIWGDSVCDVVECKLSD